MHIIGTLDKERFGVSVIAAKEIAMTAATAWFLSLAVAAIPLFCLTAYWAVNSDDQETKAAFDFWSRGILFLFCVMTCGAAISAIWGVVR